MKRNKNLILTDIANANHSWNLYKEFAAIQCGEWEILSFGQSLKKGPRKALRILMYFLYPIYILARSRKYGIIFSHQQFYGLNLALWLDIFHLSKRSSIIISTFIYKPKKGILARIFDKYMRKTVCSKHIVSFIVRSSSEVSFYEEYFGIKDKFHYIPFAMYATAPKDITPQDPKYIFGIGRSNRDWDFLADSIKGTEYKAIIACDTYHVNESENKNVTVLTNCFGEEMHKLLAKCYVVVIPLKDTNISAGQMAFLEAMEYGKPVIVTRSNGVIDYIKDGHTGFLIENKHENLLSTLKQLYTNKEKYNYISKNAQEFVRTTLTPQKTDTQIAKLILNISNTLNNGINTHI